MYDKIISMISDYNTGVIALPKKKSEDKRESGIRVMFTESELLALRKFARGRGLTVSSYVRVMALADFYKQAQRLPTAPGENDGGAVVE